MRFKHCLIPKEWKFIRSDQSIEVVTKVMQTIGHLLSQYSLKGLRNGSSPEDPTIY